MRGGSPELVVSLPHGDGRFLPNVMRRSAHLQDAAVQSSSREQGGCAQGMPSGELYAVLLQSAKHAHSMLASKRSA